MPSRWSERRQRFRAILQGGACVHPASVHDPVSARIAAGMFADSVASPDRAAFPVEAILSRCVAILATNVAAVAASLASAT
jgi:2-methylisocitrate lyase-like PEP mutase family enzyme